MFLNSRTELPIDDHVLIETINDKLITNIILDSAGCGELIFPNSTSVVNSVEAVRLNCEHRYLFDIYNDLTEHSDIIKK